MTRTAAPALVVLLLAACGGSLGSPTPTAGPASPTPASSTPTPAVPSPAGGLYLRAWLSQALPSPATFGLQPMLTITDGRVIDGNVAVPAIYPGPLLILPFARDVTEEGRSAVVDAAQSLGLLGDQTDFTGGMAAPGSQVGHIEFVIDGERRELLGDPGLMVRCDPDNRCVAEPGTPEAFAAFWQQLGYLDGWLATELGPATTYEPERVAVLTQPPQPLDPGMQPQIMPWPLDAAFADFGIPLAGDAASRCATVSGADLEGLLPALNAANQLTIFIDAQDVASSLIARAVVPGEGSPCSDEA